MSSDLEIAIKAATVAGNEIKALCERKVDSDVGKDIKLAADKISEEIIIDRFLMRETSYSILSEERGLIVRDNDGYMWIVDPLDGSANFVKKMDELCCVSIALWHRDKPILGVINRFATNDLYSGIVDKGAWKNGNRITTSDVSQCEKAFLSTGFPVFRDYSEKGLKEFITDIQNFKKIRMFGTAAVMGAFVSEGHIDAYMEDGIMLWDIAASTAIVMGAGGIADIKLNDEYKCECYLFANDKLRRSYYDICENRKNT